LEAGALVAGFHAGGVGFHFEEVAVGLSDEAFEFGLASAELEGGVERGLLDVGVGEFEDTESGCTTAPGRRTMCSTRPLVRAAIQRMSTGTRVPRPRTSRLMEPCLTVSIQTRLRSTVGAGGLEAGEEDGDAGKDDRGDGPDDDQTAAFVFGGVGARNVHDAVPPTIAGVMPAQEIGCYTLDDNRIEHEH
jgi:hypothetical protein